MQIKSLRVKSYRSWQVEERRYSKIALNRYKILKHYELLRQEGCSEHVALKVIGVSRATLYRWRASYERGRVAGLEPKSSAPVGKRKPQWSRQAVQQVLHLRRQYPLWGKRTITTILRRDQGLELSESTVGRILTHLLREGKIKPVCFYYSRVKPKRARIFNRHAKRWRKGMKSRRPGELIQIDHMSVSVWPGVTVKHFEATCPITKMTVAQAYRCASSATAAEFLEYVREKLPFAITSIQVDGGSEFRQDFEAACEQSDIPLFVLPPKSPELNGCVERCNRTLRYEFYQLYDGLCEHRHLREALAGYMHLYNTYRPHQALNQATPLEYYQQLILEAA